MDERRTRFDDAAPAPQSPLILIAGENNDTRELYSLVLTNSGFSVIEARECAQTSELAVSASPDAIVVDLPPHSAGLEVLHSLRRNESTLHIPILVLAGGTLAAHEAAIRAIADAHCAKPCMPADFLKRLKNILFLD